MFGFGKKKQINPYFDVNQERANLRRQLKMEQEEREAKIEQTDSLLQQVRGVKEVYEELNLGGGGGGSEDSDFLGLMKMAMANKQGGQQAPAPAPPAPASQIDLLINMLPAQLVDEIQAGKMTEKAFIKNSEPLLKMLYNKIVGD